MGQISLDPQIIINLAKAKIRANFFNVLR